jgi:hypothetical protein
MKENYAVIAIKGFFTVLIALSMVFLLVGGALSAVIYDESTDGDLSWIGELPTVLTLDVGSNELIGMVQSPFDVWDPFAFIIPNGYRLVELILLDLSFPAAFSLFDGLDAQHNFIGGVVAQPVNIGSDLLSLMNIEGVPPLLAGSYSARFFAAGETPRWYHLDIIIEIGVSERIQNPDNGHWYQIFENTMTWHDAKDYCESMDGYLATISSQQENDFVFDNLVNPIGHLCWLGGTDEDVEGVWQWITGEAWEYTNWAPGEPNDACGGEDYLHIYDGTGWWNDEDNDGFCGGGLKYPICEWVSVPIQI